MPTTPRRLLLSIHDVGPKFEAQVDVLADRLTRLLDGPRFAMLVVPDHWGQAPLSGAAAYQAKLRCWSDAGVEMFVHGWSHRDDSQEPGFSQKYMTAGEGEFAALGAAEAGRRMEAGRDVVEQAIGRSAAGFIAPAWLYSESARTAAAQAGFALAEDHMRIWEPVSGKVLARGPVITWASRSKARIASSLAFSALARQALHVLPTVRIAVHPGDAGVPALLKSIDATVLRFARARAAGRYADLLA
jgi:uncharacterized protein